MSVGVGVIGTGVMGSEHARYGLAVGSALGAFIFGMTTEGVIYADWDPDWFQFFVGAMLLLATVVNTWIRARASKGK